MASEMQSGKNVVGIVSDLHLRTVIEFA